MELSIFIETNAIYIHQIPDLLSFEALILSLPSQTFRTTKNQFKISPSRRQPDTSCTSFHHLDLATS